MKSNISASKRIGEKSNLRNDCYLKLMTKIFYAYFKYPCRGTVEGVERIVKLKNTSCIFAINHSSYLDWLILWGYFYYEHNVCLTFFAKEKLFSNPIFGPLMYQSRCIMVSNDGKRIIDTNRKCALIETPHIAIFPEGLRTRNGKMMKFKSGVIRYAKQLRREIVPVGLSGFFDAWPPHLRFPRIRKLTIRVGQPFFPASEHIEEDLAKLMHNILLLCEGHNEIS